MVSKFFKKQSPLVGIVGMGGGLARFSGASAPAAVDFDLEFLVIAGGGYGGGTFNSSSAGGGAGGYISSVTGESSGGGASAITPYALQSTSASSASCAVTVGAATSNSSLSTTDKNGVFQNQQAIAGGAGVGSSGGSGSGGDVNSAGGSGTAGQGFAGALGPLPYSECTQSQYYDHRLCRDSVGGGGGGGAGAAGSGLNGGNGVQSSITGTATYYAGGGNGVSYSPGLTPGTSGLGSTNYGGGTSQPGAVIVRYPDTVSISNPGGGLTMTTSTVGTNRVTVITAGSGNIEFSI